MATWPLQTPIGARAMRMPLRWADRIEARLEAERERIALWLPVMLGIGIASWFALPARAHWIGLLLLLAGGGLIGMMIGWQRRLGRVLTIGCGVAAAGVLLVWGRALWVAEPVLAYPVTTRFSALVESVEPLPARGATPIIFGPQAPADHPPRVRVTLRGAQEAEIAPGEYVGMRARLMPPPVASLPGGYDFAQRAWFDRIGAVGTALGEVTRAPDAGRTGQPLRARLSAHIHDRVAGSPGGIAAALVTGDRGAISERSVGTSAPASQV
jgi:competence protein ComEC